MGLHYPLAAFVHLLSAVLVTGYALFWAIMTLSLARSPRAGESASLLALVAAARWPHVAVPHAWRLPFTVLGWLLLAGAIGSGLLAGAVGGPRELGLVFWLKLASVIVLLGLHHRLVRRPRGPVAWAGLILVLAILVLSVPLVR